MSDVTVTEIGVDGTVVVKVEPLSVKKKAEDHMPREKVEELIRNTGG